MDSAKVHVGPPDNQMVVQAQPMDQFQQQGMQMQQGYPQQQQLQQPGQYPQQQQMQQGYPQQQGMQMQQGYPQQQGMQMQQGYPQQQGMQMQQGYPQQQGMQMQQMQPPPGPQVTVIQIGQQQQQGGVPPMGSGQWKAGLFDICSGGPVPCLMAFYCPCILFGQNMDKLGKGFCGNCCMFACAAYCSVCCFVTSGPRGEIRYRHGIMSGNDCCITMMCAQCALIQEAKQLSNV